MPKQKNDNTIIYVLVAGVLGYLAGRYLRKAGTPEFSLDQGSFVTTDKATPAAALPVATNMVIPAEGGNLQSAGAVPIQIATQQPATGSGPFYVNTVGPFQVGYKSNSPIIG